MPLITDPVTNYANVSYILLSNICLSTAADSQESVSPPPSPTDSATSESTPTLVHIKQETMPPGTDVKEYYGAIDFNLSDTYLSPNYSDYGRLHRPLDWANQGLDLKNPIEPKKGDESDDTGDLCLPIELIYKNSGIFARVNITTGNKYGPFKGKWETQPLDRRYAWEVSFFLLLMTRPSFSV